MRTGQRWLPLPVAAAVTAVLRPKVRHPVDGGVTKDSWCKPDICTWNLATPAMGRFKQLYGHVRGESVVP